MGRIREASAFMRRGVAFRLHRALVYRQATRDFDRCVEKAFGISLIEAKSIMNMTYQKMMLQLLDNDGGKPGEEFIERVDCRTDEMNIGEVVMTMRFEPQGIRMSLRAIPAEEKVDNGG